MDFFENIKLNDLFRDINFYLGFNGPFSIIKAILDIGVVSYVIYRIFLLVKQTRAWQLIKGILFILLAAKASELTGLSAIAFMLNTTIQYLAIALVVLFQPELRRGLEQIGRSRFKDFFNFEEESERLKITAIIEEIVRAATEFSKTFTGALIVVEGNTKIGEIVTTGTILEANVSSDLLLNIFTPKTPLHDGAAIVRNGRIMAAACLLPLTENPNLGRELGTRHRAALGITEVSDAIAVVVSEETGKISVALGGGLTRNLTADMLRKALNKKLLESNNPTRKIALWKVKAK